jgi:hypothetical protein
MRRPDPKLTPGAVWTVRAADICGKVLPPTPKREQLIILKHEVFSRYHLPWSRQNRYAFKIDQLVPPSLGGDYVLTNLWPEPWDEAKKKEKIEDKMALDFCKHDGTDEGLSSLQKWFEASRWAQ